MSDLVKQCREQLSEDYNSLLARIAHLEQQFAAARDAMKQAAMSVDGAVETIVADVSPGRARLKSELTTDELTELFEWLVEAQKLLAK